MLYMMLIMAMFVSFRGDDQSDVPSGYDAKLYKKAVKIAQSNIILDGHIDVPHRLLDEMENIAESTEEGDFDYPRAQDGGLDVPFMSIYIPARLQDTPGASKAEAEKLIALMDSIISANPDKFAHAGTPVEAKENFEEDLISLPYGMENGSALESDLANVEYFYNQGIRYITLTHAKMNQICDSSYDSNKGWGGLSPFGEKVVAEMNRVGIMVDISHVSDSAFYQVLRLTKVPPICSHSSSRHFTPGWERNVSDDMLKELAKKEGVIQINFGSAFLTKPANKYSGKYWAYRQKYIDEHNIMDNSDPRIEKEMRQYKKDNPYPYANIEDVVDHIDHAVKVAGIDHVGLGSDFDGVGDSLPTELKSVADYPNLVYHLLKRGYTEADIVKILSGNILRVWQQVLDYAEKTKKESEN